jgi:hypothetical protein
MGRATEAGVSIGPWPSRMTAGRSRGCWANEATPSGLVNVTSALEACDAYKPWHDKQSHRTFIRPDSGNCLHYYFYFMDAWMRGSA